MSTISRMSRIFASDAIMDAMRKLHFISTAGIFFLVFACGLGARDDAQEFSKSCRALVGMKIPAAQIGLPTHGARIAGAESEITRPSPAVCVVKGAIAPVDPSAPDINFQINLPSNWNEKAVHGGGGGYDGVLVSGLNFPLLPGPSQRDGADHVEENGSASQAGDIPLMGYVTFGSDSGHQWNPNDVTSSGSFALNAEALENFGGSQLKKAHDVAIIVTRKFYGREPRRMYFFGGSQGGHEALTVAQRWPKDYDGVVSIHPAYNLTALQLHGVGLGQRLYRRPGEWLSPLKSGLIANAVLKTCDSLDGLTDGVIANVAACRATFDVRKLACPGGGDEGPHCLSNTQIATAEFISSEMKFGFSVSGETGVGGWPLLEGGGTDKSGFGFFGFGTRAVSDRPPGIEDCVHWVLADQLVRYMVMGDSGFDSLAFEPAQHIAAIRRLAKIIDASSSDLDTFRRRGGKLLLMHGTVDMAIPPSNSITYYGRLKERYGASLRDFMRFYVAPGFGHGDGPFSVTWDWLGTLDRWADAGASPTPQMVVDRDREHGGRSMPLCEYPAWPKYRGSGDPKDARSFVCTSDGTGARTPTPATIKEPFKTEIDQFFRADQENPPDACQVLFVGSSSIVKWKTLSSDMAPMPVLNRGFGGSSIEDVNRWFDQVVAPYRPRAIVLYAGENDLDSGKSVEHVVADFDSFMARKAEVMGPTPVYFISLKPSKLRFLQLPLQGKVNEAIQARADQRADLYYIDVSKLMLQEGRPKDLFVADGLHMDSRGYLIWTDAVRAVMLPHTDAEARRCSQSVQ